MIIKILKYPYYFLKGIIKGLLTILIAIFSIPILTIFGIIEDIYEYGKENKK